MKKLKILFNIIYILYTGSTVDNITRKIRYRYHLNGLQHLTQKPTLFSIFLSGFVFRIQIRIQIAKNRKMNGKRCNIEGKIHDSETPLCNYFLTGTYLYSIYYF